MSADGSPNVGFPWAMQTRANDDDQSDPMTGDEWSQAHHITINGDETPVLMLGTPIMEQDAAQIEEQSRTARMCDLLRMKRFDATSADEEPKDEPTNTADPSMFVEAPEPEPTKFHHSHGHGHAHGHGHSHGHHFLVKEDKSDDGNSDSMPNGRKQMSNQEMQAFMDQLSSQVSQRNPMVGQEWKHRPQPVHVSEESKQAVDAAVAQFEQMTGRSGSMMDQAVAMQNPMSGQQFAVNDNSGSSMLGATAPSASDVLSAGVQQMVNLPPINPVSFIFRLFVNVRIVVFHAHNFLFIKKIKFLHNH